MTSPVYLTVRTVDGSPLDWVECDVTDAGGVASRLVELFAAFGATHCTVGGR